VTEQFDMAEQRPPAPPDDEVVALAGQVFALLARGADTARVNVRGQTALGAAVFQRSEAGVAALLAGGADPAQGSPSALDVARFFDLPDMLRLLTADRGA
jgi:ankyrin repeat protein